MTLTASERETLVITSEADDFWEIFTYNSKMQRELAKFAREFPLYCERIKEDAETGSVTYRVGKKQVSILFRKPRTEEYKQAARERIAKMQAEGKWPGKKTS